MRTGLTKKQKITNIYFTEADDLIEVCTYNTDLKKTAGGIRREISLRMPPVG